LPPEAARREDWTLHDDASLIRIKNNTAEQNPPSEPRDTDASGGG
jgi:hypothetical protein